MCTSLCKQHSSPAYRFKHCPLSTMSESTYPLERTSGGKVQEGGHEQAELDWKPAHSRQL